MVCSCSDTSLAETLMLDVNLTCRSRSNTEYRAQNIRDVATQSKELSLFVQEICTVADKDRFDKAMMKTQRNGVLAFSALLLYW